MASLVVYLLIYQHVLVARCAELIADLTGGTGPSPGCCHGMLARCATAVHETAKTNSADTLHADLTVLARLENERHAPSRASNKIVEPQMQTTLRILADLVRRRRWDAAQAGIAVPTHACSPARAWLSSQCPAPQAARVRHTVSSAGSSRLRWCRWPTSSRPGRWRRAGADGGHGRRHGRFTF